MRGMLWAGLGVMLLHLIKKGKTGTIIIMGLCFGLIPSVQLIFTNPFMPDMVRLAHFLEMSSSNCIFGIIIALFFFPYYKKEY